MDEKQKALQTIFELLVEYQITLGEVEKYYIEKSDEKISLTMV